MPGSGEPGWRTTANNPMSAESKFDPSGLYDASTFSHITVDGAVTVGGPGGVG